MNLFVMTLLLGLPLVALVVAIVLMIWRAFKPRRNKIKGLTSASGEIVNPYVYAGMWLILMLCSAGFAYLISRPIPSSSTTLGQIQMRLGEWSGLLLSIGGSKQYFNKYKKCRSLRTRNMNTDA
jgi:hypothetical protein